LRAGVSAPLLKRGEMRSVRNVLKSLLASVTNPPSSADDIGPV
jgi:hypothetical protein